MNEFYMRLPRNKKESWTFTLIVSLISVNTIGPLSVMFEAGFTMDVYLNILSRIPLIWLGVLVCIFFAKRLAGWLKAKIISPNDSYNSQIMVTTLCTVIFMSMMMSIVGPILGTGTLSLTPFEEFFYRWPRNFAIALFIELCVAQPIAREVMFRLHQRTDRKAFVQEGSGSVAE